MRFKAEEARRLTLEAKEARDKAEQLMAKQARARSELRMRLREKILQAAFNGYERVRLSADEFFLEEELGTRGFIVKWTKNDPPRHDGTAFAHNINSIRKVLEQYKEDPSCHHVMLDELVFAMGDFDRHWRAGTVPLDAYLRLCEKLIHIFENKYPHILEWNHYLNSLVSNITSIKTNIEEKNAFQEPRSAHVSWSDATYRLSQIEAFLEDEKAHDTSQNEYTLPFANRLLVEKYIKKFSQYEGRYFSGPAAEWISSDNGKEFFSQLSRSIKIASSRAEASVDVFFQIKESQAKAIFNHCPSPSISLGLRPLELVPLVKRFGYICTLVPSAEKNQLVLKVSWL